MAQGTKFGIISLEGMHLEADFKDELHLAPGLRLHRQPPYPIDEHWKEWLGSLALSRYEDATLHIVSEVATDRHEILDAQHEEAHRRAFEVYWCLMLVDFLRLQGAPLSLQGSVSPDGVPGIRSAGNQREPVVLQGSPIPTWNVQQLGTALRLQTRLERMTVFSRLRRILDAFHSGVHSSSPDFRLHQFVRCIEGFIAAERGSTEKRFKSRTELFVGPAHHDLMGRLYGVRSRVEHLHDPIEAYSGSRFKRWLSLWHDAVVAEELARFIIRRFVLQDALWTRFRDEDSAVSFWRELSDRDRRELWGEPADVSAITDSFRGKYLDPEDLGLTEADR